MLREKSRLEAELDRLDTLKNCHASMLDWQEMAQELSGGAEIKEGGDAALRILRFWQGPEDTVQFRAPEGGKQILVHLGLKDATWQRPFSSKGIL